VSHHHHDTRTRYLDLVQTNLMMFVGHHAAPPNPEQQQQQQYKTNPTTNNTNTTETRTESTGRHRSRCVTSCLAAAVVVGVDA